MADGDHARLQRGTPNNTIIIIIYLQSGASLVLRSCFGWMLAMFEEKPRQKKKIFLVGRNLAEVPNYKNYCDRQGACPL